MFIFSVLLSNYTEEDQKWLKYICSLMSQVFCCSSFTISKLYKKIGWRVCCTSCVGGQLLHNYNIPSFKLGCAVCAVALIFCCLPAPPLPPKAHSSSVAMFRRSVGGPSRSLCHCCSASGVADIVLLLLPFLGGV